LGRRTDVFRKGFGEYRKNGKNAKKTRRKLCGALKRQWMLLVNIILA
jgi:hypothetical protein